MAKEWIIVYGQGIDIHVHNDRLVIRHGFRALQDWQDVEIERGMNNVDHIVVVAYSGKISVDAVKWIMAQDMMVSFVDDYSGRTAAILPRRHISPVVKRRQATAGWTVNGPIAAWLLGEKLLSAADVLTYYRNKHGTARWWTVERSERIAQAVDIIRERAETLPACSDPEEMRIVEAQAAAAYWAAYEGVPLAWRNPWKTPRHWLSIGKRTSPKTGGPRRAVDPFHAALNYCYAVLESTVERTCVMQGVDPDFGIIHADRSDRASLVFDLMEPLRPRVDRMLFDWMMGRTFDRDDFFQTAEGICRVSPNVSREIIPAVKGMEREVMGIVKRYAENFKNRTIIERPVSASDRKMRARMAATRLEPAAVVNRKLTETRRTCAAPDCGREFIPRNGKQLYCSYRCRDREKMRRYREEREKAGRCIQCGGTMDYPPSKHGNKRSPKYCSKCQEYFRTKYRRHRAGN